ncbi:phage baseplate protein [Vibrio parahaemolyticus]|uniref:phage baseplate protein n=1 Tax=Vibrio parahaemolyticus TaxID=670 RepID=UPI003735FEBB
MIVPTYIMDNNNSRLYADAFTEVIPTYNAQATRYPVSDKSTVSLNVIKSNPILNLTFYVGRNPIKQYDGLVGYENLDQRPSRTNDVLLNWYNNSTKLTIINELYQFKDYIVTSYSPRQVSTTTSYEYKLTLEHIRHVSYSRGTLIQSMDESKQIDAQTKTSQGDSSSKSQANTEKSLTRQVWEFYNDNGVVDLQNPPSKNNNN